MTNSHSREGDEDRGFSILTTVGDGSNAVALVQTKHLNDSSQTEFHWSGVVDLDTETGTTASASLNLGTPLTVLEAIDRYAPLVAEGDREWLRMQRARGDDPLWILRNIDPDNELASPSGPLRDPESVTEDAGRDRAAAEIMRHSLEALFTLQEYGEYGTLLSTTGARRFYRELEGAALRHPTVVLALLYASRREHHGWVQ